MTPADWTEDARLEEVAERATPQGEVETVDRDGVPTYRVHGAPCGFPIAQFGDHADLDLFRVAKAHLPRLLRERREAVELLRDCALALESAAALATLADMKQSIAPSYHEDAARVRAFLSSIAEKTE
jgi:hypothetical protein